MEDGKLTEQEHYWEYMKRKYNEKDSQLPEGRLPYEEWLKTKQYAVVTTVSSHRIRYVVPLDQLQELNPDAPVAAEWLADSVVMGEVEEFSQDWLGEQILDADVISEQQMLSLFDKDNDYLRSWSTEQKIDSVRKALKSTKPE